MHAQIYTTHTRLKFISSHIINNFAGALFVANK